MLPGRVVRRMGNILMIVELGGMCSSIILIIGIPILFITTTTPINRWVALYCVAEKFIFLTDKLPINGNRVSDFVQIAEGVELQKRVWRELLEEMERIQPGISQII